MIEVQYQLFGRKELKKFTKQVPEGDSVVLKRQYSLRGYPEGVDVVAEDQVRRYIGLSKDPQGLITGEKINEVKLKGKVAGTFGLIRKQVVYKGEDRG